MPRNAASILKTEALCLPNIVENKTKNQTITRKTNISPTKRTTSEKNTVNQLHQLLGTESNNDHDDNAEELDEEDEVEIIIPDLTPITTAKKLKTKNVTVISKAYKTSAAFANLKKLNIKTAYRNQKIINVDTESEISDTVLDSPLYPAIFDLTVTSPKSSTTTKGSIETSVPFNICTKLPAVTIKVKSISKSKRNKLIRDNNRIATLRARKNPSPEKSVVTKKKKKLPVQKQELVIKAPAPKLTVAEFDKIEVLEYDEAKASGGTSGGTKRKRNNSLTSGTFGTITAYPRKRAATAKNINNSNQIHAVEQKGGGNTISSMSLCDRRYQTSTATPSNEGTRVVGNNGYLSSTRSSSASSGVMHTSSDNGIVTDVPMESQYFLTSGNASISNTAATPIINGGGSSGGNLLTNHAPSMATLCNIGNSCYLNSVVYTLRFAPRFLHNLHHLIVDLATVQQNILRQRAKSSSLGRGINAAQLDSSARSWSSKDLASLEQYSTTALQSGNVGGGNGDICKSRHQLLTEKLHELYQSLHRNEVAESTEPHHADKLLHAIQDVSPIFEGNQQQDAHEFLMCVLNSIRETCQTLIKMIAECPELIAEGNIMQHDEIDKTERDLPPTITTQVTTTASSSSQSSSLGSIAWFTSRKSKRKEEAKSAKNSRLQSPLKDAVINSNLQAQTVANSHFYLNSVDLSGNTATTTTTAAITVSSPTTHNSPPLNFNHLTISTSLDTSDSLVSQQPLGKQRLAEKIRELGLDFFSEDFEGITVATTKCLSCETITEQKESMIDIAVPVPISGYDSSDYTEKPSAFIQNSCITREYFRGENKYRCEQCTGYTEAIRSISYEVLPRLLVIQLSRFSGGMEKINSYIPTSFTLQCFCSKCCELSDANKLHVYKLYSVITHVGATMSVGHYIAYTCSLDWVNEYTNCPKDRRSNVQQQQQQQQQQSNGVIQQQQQTSQVSAASAAASAFHSSGTSLMKKMKFVRNKASSSGDISKNIKNLNGMTNAAAAAAAAAAASNSQTITNGINKLSLNTTCHSLSCCATRLSKVQHQHQQQQQFGINDLSEESMQNGANHNAVTSSSSSGVSLGSYSSGYGSTGRGGTKSTPFAANSNGAEPIWYMCDDDKIKAMTQREFEELLSPSRKITITPYLLFYARFDLQPVSGCASMQQTTAASNQTTPQSAQSAAAMSWSNESLQSSNLHKV